MDMKEILGLPKNSDFILFNTLYHKKAGNDGKEDAITLVLKNMKTGEKLLRTIDNPLMEVYMAKPDVELGKYNHMDISKDLVDCYDVSYKNILRDLCKLIGQEDYYWNCIKQRRYDDLKQIQAYNRFFSSDRHIEDFYRYKCLHHFGQKELIGTTKGFLDIEADIKIGNIDFKKGTGSAPINAITFIDGSRKISYTVILRNPDNPQIQELEDDLEGFIEELDESFRAEYGKIDYKIAFFDDEVDLIRTTFKIINTLKLDFIMAWNAAFDYNYMMNRLIILGEDPIDIMCHDDFKYKECLYVKDQRNFEIKKKTDWFYLSSYSVFIDQMINYAAIRKSQAKIDSYKLDFIGNKEVNARKLDYSDIGHIKDFPYKNFRKFIKYNINDVLVQYKIENKTSDVDNLFYRSYASNTRYSKVFKEITFLTTSSFDVFYNDYGLVLGNNVNALKYSNSKDEDDEKFEGALVGDPTLIMPVGIKILGNRRSTTVMKNVVDYDFTSLYPSIIKLFNIYKSTLIGQVVLGENINTREHRVVDEKYNRGAKFMEDLEINEPIHFGYRWLNLPSIKETMNLVEDMLGDDAIRKVRIGKSKKNKLETRKIVIRRKEKVC